MEIFFDYSVLFEITGAVLSLVYLVFSIRKSIWLWPVGLLASSFYIVVYYYSKLYAEMGLQVYYIAVSIYGWYYWFFGKTAREGNHEIPVVKLTKRDAFLYIFLFLLFYTGLFLLLKNFTDSPIPGWDSLATAMSLVATWMLARKILENWIVWIVADAICIGISLYKNLYFTAILFGVYTVMAFVGYLNWKKSLK